MSHIKSKQLPNLKGSLDPSLLTYQEALDLFMDSRNVYSKSTQEFYAERLQKLTKFIKGENVETLGDITHQMITNMVGALEGNPGGRHTTFRALRAFFNYFVEVSDYTYRSPMARIKPPKLIIEPLPGVRPEEIIKLIDSCHGRNSDRDKAIFTFLFDTGVRSAELLDLKIGDIDYIKGTAIIRQGKGGKKRTVMFSKKARRALRGYLKERGRLNERDPLFCAEDGERLTYSGLRMIITRRSANAGIHPPGLHDFRRAFALAMHRAGVSDITLSRLLGHSTLEVLKRYLAEDEDDLSRAHEKGSPADHYL